MEAHEKLSSISDSLEALEVGRAGRVSRVKSWRVNKISQSLISWKVRKFVDCENFLSYGSMIGANWFDQLHFTLHSVI